MITPNTDLRILLSRMLVAMAQKFGTRIKDEEGRLLCRAFLFTWRGSIHLIGLPRGIQLEPVPAIRKRVTYWRQSIIWRQSKAPDFPRLAGKAAEASMPMIAHVVICHLSPVETEAVFERWVRSNPGELVLIAYGGKAGDFKNLPPTVTAVWIPDASLRTADHARERQEYAGVFRETDSWLASNAPEISHVHVVEFDVIPTVTCLGTKLLEALVDARADVLGYGALDISGSIHPHNSHELSNALFLDFLATISQREVKDRLLTMLGCSTFWTRECFDTVAQLNAPRVYLEIGMATLPHHLGYRVRPMPEAQQRFVSFEGDYTADLEALRREGAWSVHPCKQFWRSDSAAVRDSGMKPKLLLCSHTYGAVANRAKATALSEWFDVLLCFPEMSGIQIMGKDGSAQDGEVVDAPYQLCRLPRWPRSAGFTKCLMIGLQREIHRWQPDIILCEEEPWSFARWQARIGSWLSKKRPLFVEFTWENLPRQGLKGKFLRRVYRLAVSTTDGVVCGNRGSERMFMEAGLPAWRCLRTGQLGIDPAEHPIPTTSEKAAWRNRLGFPQDAFVAGFCGRFVEEKGILDLLEAIEQLREQGLDLFLVYLGAGPLEAELKSRTRDAAWFQILPPVAHAQVPEIICHFDLFVLPSKPQLDPSKGIWEEQFGHVLIEAMMSAVPCIGSDSGGIPEVLEDPEVLFPPGNIHELIRLIRQLATHPDQRAALGKAQREATLRRWTHEALAERYSKFILHLLSPT